MRSFRRQILTSNTALYGVTMGESPVIRDRLNRAVNRGIASAERLAYETRKKRSLAEFERDYVGVYSPLKPGDFPFDVDYQKQKLP